MKFIVYYGKLKYDGKGSYSIHTGIEASTKEEAAAIAGNHIPDGYFLGNIVQTEPEWDYSYASWSEKPKVIDIGVLMNTYNC